MTPFIKRKIIHRIVKRRRKSSPRFGILQRDFQTPRAEITVTEQPAFLQTDVAFADDTGQPFGLEIVFKNARRDPCAQGKRAARQIPERIVLDVIGSAVHIQAVAFHALSPKRIARGFHQVDLIGCVKDVVDRKSFSADFLFRHLAVPFIERIIREQCIGRRIFFIGTAGYSHRADKQADNQKRNYRFFENFHKSVLTVIFLIPLRRSPLRYTFAQIRR